MRKIFVLPIFLTCLMGAVGSAFAQTATLTATVRPNPLIVEIIAPSNVTVGQWFDINVQVTNLGAETIRQTVANLNTPTEIAVRGKNKKLGNLEGGETKMVTWKAKANTSGDFIIQAEATGELVGEQISATDSIIISATSSLARFWLRTIFGV